MRPSPTGAPARGEAPHPGRRSPGSRERDTAADRPETAGSRAMATLAAAGSMPDTASARAPAAMHETDP